MRFHLVDRVDAVDPWRSVTARKLTGLAEEFWRDDGDGPQMPAPLVLEAFCQAGTWLVLESSDLRQRAALLSMERVDVVGLVRPGDVLQLTGDVVAHSAETAVLSGVACVAGRPVLEAEAVMCALLPTEDLEDVGDVRRMRDRLLAAGPGAGRPAGDLGTRTITDGAPADGGATDVAPAGGLPTVCRAPAFERVVTAEPGRAVVVRHVPHTLDVFATHFPRFPVLPGVLILDDLVAAARLAAGERGGGPGWRARTVHRVRFRHFVAPGDVLEIAVEVTARTPSSVTCRGTVRVDDRRVATVAELVLEPAPVRGVSPVPLPRLSRTGPHPEEEPCR